MLRIHSTPDCGNAPRKEVLRDLVIALAERDGETVSALVAEGVVWNQVGVSASDGREAVRGWAAAGPEVEELSFGALITHGREASVDGTLELTDGTRHAFCHVLRFAGAARTAKIVEIRSYVLPLARS
ncbi:nuclear transport factor 2 family protein [Streptomyces sp. KLOTTS4A1]|uniref:nuclear transport factor 2 family protein n=1 Tax=Streptomyces sp. KLOTTS4A1 TaxID=3390996 RepID=UPI0039F60683